MRSLKAKLKSLEKKLEAGETEVIIYKITLSTSKPHFANRCKACDAPVPHGLGKVAWVVCCDPQSCSFWEGCD
jgi:hypothetical protein